MKQPAQDNQSLSLHLNVLIERQSNGVFLAHCLELDLLAEGKTSEQAFEDLLNVVDVQIRTCVDNDNLDNLFFPAPKEAWNKLVRVQQVAGCQFSRTQRSLPKRIRNFENVEVDQFCYA